MKIDEKGNMACSCSLKKSNTKNSVSKVVTKRVPTSTKRAATSGRRVVRRVLR